jgi:hypothetical protein
MAARSAGPEVARMRNPQSCARPSHGHLRRTACVSSGCAEHDAPPLWRGPAV